MVRGSVTGRGRPGYEPKATMAAESALSLALDRAGLTPFSGILTPAAGLGFGVCERLETAPIELAIDREPAREMGASWQPASIATFPTRPHGVVPRGREADGMRVEDGSLAEPRCGPGQRPVERSSQASPGVARGMSASLRLMAY